MPDRDRALIVAAVAEKVRRGGHGRCCPWNRPVWWLAFGVGRPAKRANAVRASVLAPRWDVVRAASKFALSPDGTTAGRSVGRERPKAVLHCGIRTLSTAAAHRLDGTEGAAFPFWSPDSRHMSASLLVESSQRSIDSGRRHSPCLVRSAKTARRQLVARTGVILFRARRARTTVSNRRRTAGKSAARRASSTGTVSYSWPGVSFPTGPALLVPGPGHRRCRLPTLCRCAQLEDAHAGPPNRVYGDGRILGKTICCSCEKARCWHSRSRVWQLRTTGIGSACGGARVQRVLRAIIVPTSQSPTGHLSTSRRSTSRPR
jgi:hypothetical protein